MAHGLGGVIVKDVCVSSPSGKSVTFTLIWEQAIRRSDICQLRTKLVVFLGTPHRGSAHAGWGAIMSNLASVALQDSNKRLVKTLEVNNEVLDNIQYEFRECIYQKNIQIHSFQEARGISGVKGLHGKARILIAGVRWLKTWTDWAYYNIGSKRFLLET